MYDIKKNFDRIKAFAKNILSTELPESENLLRQGPKPKFTDLDVITLALTGECLEINSENRLFKAINSDYPNSFPCILSRRQFNDRRKALIKLVDKVRVLLLRELDDGKNMFIVDATPIRICKLSRAKRCKFRAKANEIRPDAGYCATQKENYFGYKGNAICNTNGVVQVFELSPASVHDVNFLDNIGIVLQDCTLIGDKGYVSQTRKELFLKESNIDIQAEPRKNQKNKLPFKFKRIRKRIETLFSQLNDQFCLQKNFAKTHRGLWTRITTKLSACTLLQYFNKINNKPIGELKYALSKFNM